jgi:hypothetical protein
MSSMPDWSVWALALVAVALFAWFFWHTGTTMLDMARRLVATTHDWPQTRRAMVEAEAQAGGRYPLWFRALRVLLILALLVLCAMLLWRKVFGM